MLITTCPKLPMCNRSITYDYYVNKLGFDNHGDFPDYLMVSQDNIELHFFLYQGLDPLQNYGQVYIRVQDISAYYTSLIERNIAIHPNGPLQDTPWGQREFSLLDPDHNLLTFGEGL